MKRLKRRSWMLGLGLGLGLAACTSVPPPRDSIGRARASLDAAEKAGAAQDAPLELRKSRDQLAKADDAMREQHYEEARRAAEAAEVDAQYASTRAHRARSEREFEELSKTVKAVQEEANHEHP